MDVPCTHRTSFLALLSINSSTGKRLFFTIVPKAFRTLYPAPPMHSLEFMFESTFQDRTIRKIVCDDVFWYVLSDILRALGKEAKNREKPQWERKWPRKCRRFSIDKDGKELRVLCAQADEILEWFGELKTTRNRKFFRWLIKEWRSDWEWIEMMDHVRTLAACEDDDEREFLEEMHERDMDKRAHDEWLRSDEYLQMCRDEEVR